MDILIGILFTKGVLIAKKPQKAIKLNFYSEGRRNTYLKSKNMLATNATKFERENEDFYATNPHALEIFLQALNEDNVCLSKNVWECAVGMGHLAKVLEKEGYIVKGSDIIDGKQMFLTGDSDNY